MNPIIIFIGAGPIGLLAAIQVKLKNPTIQIVMFEKYPDPLRNHAMYVDHASFSDMERSNGFGDLLDSIPSKITISDLEKKLRDYATAIGIDIQYEEIKDFNALKQRYPETDYFVGSGGLRGIIHPQVFNNENQINEPLRYAAEIKYKAEGKARSLHKLLELPGVLSQTKHVVSEYVGHEKNGITPISLRIFVDNETYQQMKEATFKNPYTLNDENKIDPDLLKTIKVYLSGRKNITGETAIDDTIKISMITLSLYASKNFCKQENGKTIIQIGEEGFACPFYRSFNDNAKCVPPFAKTIQALIENKRIENKKFESSLFPTSKTDKNPLDYYEHYVQRLVESEIATIHRINVGIDLIETSVYSLQNKPTIPKSKIMLTSGGRTFINEVNNNNNNNNNNQDASSLPTHSRKVSFCTIM